MSVSAGEYRDTAADCVSCELCSLLDALGGIKPSLEEGRRLLQIEVTLLERVIRRSASQHRGSVHLRRMRMVLAMCRKVSRSGLQGIIASALKLTKTSAGNRGDPSADGGISGGRASLPSQQVVDLVIVRLVTTAALCRRNMRACSLLFLSLQEQLRMTYFMPLCLAVMSVSARIHTILSFQIRIFAGAHQRACTVRGVAGFVKAQKESTGIVEAFSFFGEGLPPWPLGFAECVGFIEGLAGEDAGVVQRDVERALSGDYELHDDDDENETAGHAHTAWADGDFVGRGALGDMEEDEGEGLMAQGGAWQEVRAGSGWKKGVEAPRSKIKAGQKADTASFLTSSAMKNQASLHSAGKGTSSVGMSGHMPVKAPQAVFSSFSLPSEFSKEEMPQAVLSSLTLPTDASAKLPFSPVPLNDGQRSVGANEGGHKMGKPFAHEGEAYRQEIADSSTVPPSKRKPKKRKKNSAGSADSAADAFSDAMWSISSFASVEMSAATAEAGGTPLGVPSLKSKTKGFHTEGGKALVGSEEVAKNIAHQKAGEIIPRQAGQAGGDFYSMLLGDLQDDGDDDGAVVPGGGGIATLGKKKKRMKDKEVLSMSEGSLHTAGSHALTNARFNDSAGATHGTTVTSSVPKKTLKSVPLETKAGAAATLFGTQKRSGAVDQKSMGVVQGGIQKHPKKKKTLVEGGKKGNQEGQVRKKRGSAGEGWNSGSIFSDLMPSSSDW